MEQAGGENNICSYMIGLLKLNDIISASSLSPRVSCSKGGVGERGPKKNLASQLLIAQTGGGGFINNTSYSFKKTSITGIIYIKYE